MNIINEKITKLCQGNPCALTVLERFLTNTECMDILERYDICGSDIWRLYKDCCHENIDLMIDVLNNLPSDNIKYHINHGHSGIQYDNNIRIGRVDEWIVLALNDFKEYNIYARMEIDNFGVYPSPPSEIVGESYRIWIRTKNMKNISFTYTLEQMMNMKLNRFISYILEEVENFCKHNSLRDATKLEDVIKDLREKTSGWEITNSEYSNGDFIDFCCKEHLQLMEWLIELKKYRMKYGDIK